MSNGVLVAVEAVKARFFRLRANLERAGHTGLRTVLGDGRRVPRAFHDSFDRVLLVGHNLGTPYVDGATVSGEVVGEFRDKKVIAFKFKRRKGYHTKNGHRQRYTRVKITGITGG